MMRTLKSLLQFSFIFLWWKIFLNMFLKTTELYLYCETDCIVLHQILIKYHEQIHSLLKIDITKYPTLPSIAFSGYRANFMKKDSHS